MENTINHALEIDGYMSEQELLWLAKQAAEHRCIVEIGSYLGRSTAAMLAYCSGIVYAIDDWKGPRDVYLSKEERIELYEQFIRNTKPYAMMGKLRIILGEYDELYNNNLTLGNLTPDMVFLDGSHETDDVIRDINFWKDKIPKGGLLCGHDVTFQSVQEAINHFSEILDNVHIADNTTIWYQVNQ